MPPLLLRTPVAARLQTAQYLSETRPPRGSRAPLPTLPKSEFATGGRTKTEQKILTGTLKDIQGSLCVTQTGRFDDNATRIAIRQAKLGNKLSGPNASIFNDTDNQINNSRDLSFFNRQKSCRLDKSGEDRGYRTAFEKFAFPSDDHIRSLQISLASSRCDPTLKESGKFDKETRAAIGVAKSKLKKDTKDALTDLNTETLNDKSYIAILSFCH
jgi:hypothetical protein